VKDYLNSYQLHSGRAAAVDSSGGAYTIAPDWRHAQLVWPPRHEHDWWPTIVRPGASR
jgi:hypothetical protein